MILLLLGKVEKMILTMAEKNQKAISVLFSLLSLSVLFSFKIRHSVVQASLNWTIYKQPMVAFSHLQSVDLHHSISQAAPLALALPFASFHIEGSCCDNRQQRLDVGCSHSHCSSSTRFVQ